MANPLARTVQGLRCRQSKGLPKGLNKHYLSVMLNFPLLDEWRVHPALISGAWRGPDVEI